MAAGIITMATVYSIRL